MNNEQVAHIFAQNNNQTAKGSNFHCKNGELYSYSTLIAAFDGNTLYYSEHRYSVTTSRQQSYLRRAISGHSYKKVCTSLCLDKFFGEWTKNLADLEKAIIEQYRIELDELIQACAKTKKIDLQITLILMKVEEIRQITALNELERRIVSDKLNSSVIKVLECHLGMTFKELSVKVREAAKKLREEKKARDLQRLEEMKCDFFAHKIRSIPSDFVLLRLSRDGESIETSKGANVPKDEAITFYKALMSNKITKGFKIGHFSYDESNSKAVKIGCHTIELTELSNMAKLLNVTV